MKKLNELKVNHSQRQNIQRMEKTALEEQRRKVDIAFQTIEPLLSAVNDASTAVQEILGTTVRIFSLSEENYRSIEKIYSGFASFKLKGESGSVT